jgi:hypothetical protein
MGGLRIGSTPWRTCRCRIWARPVGPCPFSLADPARVRAILEGVGFTDVSVDDFRCPMPMGATVEDTVAFMQGTDVAATLMADISEDVAGAAWEAVRAALAP